MKTSEKKPTNGQLQKKINNALLFIEKSKETKSVYFDDKGVRITVTNEYALVETNYHCHVFRNFTQSGLSRPYMYSKRIVELADENDCFVRDEKGKETGRSYARLIEVLKGKDDKGQYYVAEYFSWWLTNIFMPLYSIGESEVESFFVYLDFVYNVAKNGVLLSEKNEDITNRQCAQKTIDSMKEIIGDIQEVILFKKKTDEELVKENIDAIQEQEQDDAMEAQTNGY